MKTLVVLVLVYWLCGKKTDAAGCESGWSPYKDETCVKVFDDILTYHNAKNFCASQSNAVSKSTLVMVKDPELQDFLSMHTKDLYESVWLGGKYDNSTNQFTWDDQEPLTYTNWGEGFPRNLTDAEVCIQLQPVNARHLTNLEAKWEDAVCLKRNLVMCQKAPIWTLDDAVKEIIKNRKEIVDLREVLDQVNSKVVPVGSIYVEYYNQPSPATIWPTLQWQDVTNTYAGMFFRALGGNSDTWGTKQNECAPRINQMRHGQGIESEPVNPLNIPPSGWSGIGLIGWNAHGNPVKEYVSFFTENCEVRPQNQAIRIWKRIA